MGVNSGTGTGQVISINTRGVQPQAFTLGGDKEERWPAVEGGNKIAHSDYDGEGDGRSAHSIPYKANGDEALSGKPGVQVTIDKHVDM